MIPKQPILVYINSLYNNEIRKVIILSKKTNQNEITNFEENIKNYGNKIEHIDSFVEAVRRFPGMYIGSKGNVGWKACIREIFQNAVDEAIRKESPCHRLQL